jgi:hypothetical protein
MPCQRKYADDTQARTARLCVQRRKSDAPNNRSRRSGTLALCSVSGRRRWRGWERRRLTRGFP